MCVYKVGANENYTHAQYEIQSQHYIQRHHTQI